MKYTVKIKIYRQIDKDINRLTERDRKARREPGRYSQAGRQTQTNWESY